MWLTRKVQPGRCRLRSEINRIVTLSGADPFRRVANLAQFLSHVPLPLQTDRHDGHA